MRKTELSPQDRIIVAYLRQVHELDLHVIAAAFAGINQGRISEAWTAIEMAAQDPKGFREKIEGADARVEAEKNRAAFLVQHWIDVYEQRLLKDLLTPDVREAMRNFVKELSKLKAEMLE